MAQRYSIDAQIATLAVVVENAPAARGALFGPRSSVQDLSLEHLKAALETLRELKAETSAKVPPRK